MIWLRQPKPAAAPAQPERVDLEDVMGAAADMSRRGIGDLALEYIRTNGPGLAVDKWGTPLPLSIVVQERLDRIVAVLAAPYDRGHALLIAGMLAPDEVIAIQSVFPDVYAGMVHKAVQDMMSTKPPYPLWAETMLSVLFQKPASAVYTEQNAPKPEASSKVKTSKVPNDMQAAINTPADRREIAIRERA